MSASWIEATFIDGEDAEIDLSDDRPAFIQRKDIMTLIPGRIRKHIVHQGDNGQIEGFQELFVHLERSPAAEDLRRLIVDYFARSPALRGHLRIKPKYNLTHAPVIMPPTPAPEPMPPSYNNTPAWTGAAPSSIVDTGDITSDSSSAHASPAREVSSSRSTSTAVASPPKLLVAGPTRSDTDPPPLSPLTQDIFLALGADPADEKLHTFQFEGRAFRKPSLEVDLLQTHQTYHRVKGANVAFLAFKLRCHEESKRPESLVLRGTLRPPPIEFAAIWPPPPSGSLDTPQLASRSLGATVSAGLGVTYSIPMGGVSFSHSSNVTWLEDHSLVETVFDNTNPRSSFKMIIKHKLGQKQIPSNMAFAAVVKFPSEHQPFVVDFDLTRGGHPRSYTAVYDGKTEILKSSDAIRPQSYAPARSQDAASALL